MNTRIANYVLLAILAVGLTLRLVNLSLPDIATDDSLYSLRSVGYIDYVASTNKQSTPVTWFPAPVWWQGLSFHDAPPLVFATQWISFQLFGDNAIAARLPFVAAGMLGIYAAYLLGTLIAGTSAGLIAAGAFAISNYAIWISRIGFLDGFLVPEIFLALYFFIKARVAPKNYLWWGIAVGAGLLTKYTFLFMGPMFLVALLTWQRRAWRTTWFYAGCALIMILVLPVIVYNVMMFQTRGHLDAALATLFGEHPEDFKVLTRATTKNFNIAAIAASLATRNTSVAIIALFIAGIAVCAIDCRKHRERRLAYLLLGLGGLWALVMLGFTSGDDHFGVVLLPFAAVTLGIGGALSWKEIAARPKSKKIFISALAIAVAWEIVFAAQSQLVAVPTVANPLLVAKNRPSFAGFAALDRYVTEFYSRYPELSTFVIFADAPQLAAYQEKLIRKRLAKDPNQPTNSHLLVFDDRMKWFAWVWMFERRRLYDFDPIPSLTQFSEKLRTNGVRFYTDLGFTDVTIITAADASVMDSVAPGDGRTAAVQKLERDLHPIDEIKNARNETVFRVFRLAL